MNFLEEIRHIDFKTPGSWPWLVKITSFIVIFFVTILLGALLAWKAQWDELQKARDKEEQLRQTFLSKKQQAINLDIIKKQLIETQQSFGALLKQLPSRSDMDALLTDINQAGLGRGLQFELFQPGKEVPTGVFTEQPIKIKVTGTYDDLGKFSSDISQLPRIVTLSDINIASDKDGGALLMEAVAKTYRYLDEEELAAQKAASAKDKKAVKK
jgi:type IV pilus assembly protein PilO